MINYVIFCSFPLLGVFMGDWLWVFAQSQKNSSK